MPKESKPQELTPEAEEYLEEIVAQAADLLDEKSAIDKKLNKLDDQIEAVLDDFGRVKPEGSKTTHVGEDFKVKATGRIYRKVDEDKWDEMVDELPDEARSVVTYKPKVSTSGFKWLRDNEPELFARVAEAITSKPGSTGIKIERKG